MSSDPNRKSQRSFQCRDILWETFEQMARELECSVDYLINESMKQYARQRSYGARTPYPSNLSNAPPPVGRRPVGSVLPPPPRSRPNMGNEAPAMGAYGQPGPSDFRPQTAPKPFDARPVLPVPPPAPQIPAIAPVPGPGSMRPSTARSVPPPIPATSGSRPPSGAPSGFPAPHQNPGSSGGMALGQLSVICDGDKVAVNKERFVIGRGKQSSDFTLKDPNVSRQHAMVEFQNGAYFIVDMGSTNGIEFGGRRVARQQIQEGDTFKICDHEIRFTFR